jgi:uncharacterized membrane protein YccC
MKRGIAILLSVILAASFLVLVFRKVSVFHFFTYIVYLEFFSDGRTGESLFIDFFDIGFALFLGWLFYKILRKIKISKARDVNSD